MHRDLRPRKWVRRLLFKDNGAFKEPRPIVRRLVSKKNGRPRALFAPWINIGFTARQNFRSSALDKMRDEIIENNKLMQVKTVTIMTTRHTDYNARVLERLLSPLGLKVQVVLDRPRVYNDDLYIVLCPQAFTRLPPPMKRIIFQLEQSGRADWFTDKYMDILTQSLAVFDYSSDNVQFLQDNGMSYRDIFELAEPSADITPVAKFKFYRGLLGLGMIDYAQFYRLTDDWTLPTDKIMLGLPENGARRAYALAQNPQDVYIFDGLRYRTGWIGCAMSYKYMAQKALDAGFETVQIFEDDADFSENYQEHRAIIKEYLAENDGWDVFSGILVDIPSHANVLDVRDYKGLRFIYLDYFVSMVYGVYPRAILQKIADYPMNDTRELIQEDDQIDIYLRRDPVRCLTTSPFLVTHAKGLDSTLWPLTNQEGYDELGTKAVKTLDEKINAFMKN